MNQETFEIVRALARLKVWIRCEDGGKFCGVCKDYNRHRKNCLYVKARKLLRAGGG